MEKSYRKILSRRNEQLLAELKWTKALARALRVEGVLSRDDIQELEVSSRVSVVF